MSSPHHRAAARSATPRRSATRKEATVGRVDTSQPPEHESNNAEVPDNEHPSIGSVTVATHDLAYTVVSSRQASQMKPGSNRAASKRDKTWLSPRLGKKQLFSLLVLLSLFALSLQYLLSRVMLARRQQQSAGSPMHGVRTFVKESLLEIEDAFRRISEFDSLPINRRFQFKNQEDDPFPAAAHNWEQRLRALLGEDDAEQSQEEKSRSIAGRDVPLSSSAARRNSQRDHVVYGSMDIDTLRYPEPFFGEIPLPPDTRPDCCQSRQHMIPSDFVGDVSLILTVTDLDPERFRHALFSTLQRTPAKLFRELILVIQPPPGIRVQYDQWGNAWRIRDVKFYVASLRFAKLKLLIAGQKADATWRAASAAKGNVLVFLDGQTEVNRGWLEPLLARLGECRNCIVQPYFDALKDEPRTYVARGLGPVGFTCKLDSFWMKPTHGNIDSCASVKTPSLAGGVLAMTKPWWEQIVGHGSELRAKQQRGELLELALRTWRCQGRVEAVPCSRVAHTFDKGFSGRIDSDDRKRLLSSWADDQEFLRECRLHRYQDVVGSQDPSLKRTKEKMQCESFDWYLRAVYRPSSSRE